MRLKNHYVNDRVFLHPNALVTEQIQNDLDRVPSVGQEDQNQVESDSSS